MGFYLVFGIVNIGILTFGIYNINNVIKIYQYSESVNLLFYHTSSMNNAVQKHLIEEVQDTTYHKTKQSYSIETYQKYYDLVSQEADKITKSSFAQNFNIAHEMRTLIKDYSTFNKNFESIIALYKYKGYKDYGQEGYMRDHIHYLESMQHILPIAHILKLRRHEKDYLLRKDPSYIAQLQNATQVLKKTIETTPVPISKAALLLKSLSNYERSFMNIAIATKEIESLQDQNLRLMSVHIHPTLGRLMGSIKMKKERLINNCIRDFVILSIIFLVSTCIIGYKLHHYQSQYLDDVETYLKNIRKGDYNNKALSLKLQQAPSMRKIVKHLQRIEAFHKKHKSCMSSTDKRRIESPTDVSIATAASKNFSKLM